MSIVSFIESKCTQTAVYWAASEEDGYGGKVFVTPVEIACRWEHKSQVVGTQVGGEVNGTLLLSRAEVFVTQDVKEEGYMYLGTLSDLTQDQIEDPSSFSEAYIIKRFEKTPTLGSTTDFLRKAFLTPYLR